MKEKKKKEKITYYDDGRTIADMSEVGRGIPRFHSQRSIGTFKEKWTTYWDAVKMMFLPMLAVAGGLGIIFLIMLILFSVM